MNDDASYTTFRSKSTHHQDKTKHFRDQHKIKYHWTRIATHSIVIELIYNFNNRAQYEKIFANKELPLHLSNPSKICR
jgi:hypothetical protein